MASFEEDYKFWQVVDPATFLPLVIVLLAVLVVIVHGAVLSADRYNWLQGSAATAAAPAAAAAPAPATPAVAPAPAAK